MNDQASENQENKRTRGKFPRLSLKDTMELPQKIYELGHGTRVRRLTVFDNLNKSPNSGPSRTLVACANSGYGLIDGNSSSDYLELTSVGKAILENNENTYEGRAAIFQALYANEIFEAFMEYFKSKRQPIDQVAIDYLHGEHGLSDQDAEVFWKVIKQNLTDYNLIEDIAGKPNIISREMVLERFGLAKKPARNNQELNEDDETMPAKPERVSVKPTMVSNSMDAPHFHFNIQVHIPADATPEEYDAIFRSIANHLLGKGSE